MSFKQTGEQTHAVELLSNNRVVKLEAGAGCTKTTTLTLMAEANKVPSIYMAFNKKMAEEAATKFPKGWVTCKTTHSVAHSVFGRDLQHKLKRPEGAYQNVCGTGSEIARFYKIRAEYFCDDDEKLITAAGLGVAVKETVARFESSADELIGPKHVSFGPAKRQLNDPTFNRTRYEHTVLAYAAMLWKERINVNSKILATHDTYLKLYQLSKPDLSQYAILYLDEMQDSSDCVIDIVQRQLNSKIVVVGDDAQAIYGWRGAVSAMQKFGGVVGQLTTSFRFGPAVAAEARMVLSLRCDGGMDLKGWDQKQSDVYDYLPPELDSAHRCILYRTNAALIQDGVDFILRGRKVALEIDTRDYIAMMNSVVALRYSDMKNVKHEEVVPYPSWKSLMEELEHIGGDIARIARVVAEDQHEKVLRALENYRKPATPDLTLTTAHKAKGREFEIVQLADDFPDVLDKTGEWIGLEDTEANLLYVGLTRAMKVLVRNKTLREIRKHLDIKDEPKPVVIDTLEVNVDFDAINDAFIEACEQTVMSLDDFYPDEMFQQFMERRVGM
ncbi:UvrD-helicase domain-containing protein [Pseudomonas sp. P8_250]|uniref:UvrD-helicase domain-containing protein n=1 Tax=Pseudomonas sp. P8_250 TaxID=3043446 RepID=UPI002A360D77|nr:UvrD-helicase domain-containing protein [Pseudomonas sp. P8_250]MDX9668680.1 AAA family ATPase [Pseudomonas sp. P8_250]